MPSTGTQSYNFEVFLKAWFYSSNYLKNSKDRKLFLMSQLQLNNVRFPTFLYTQYYFSILNLPEEHLRLMILFPIQYFYVILREYLGKTYRILKSYRKKD
jgi:hypothetical protein